jgi:hypothetical protein
LENIGYLLGLDTERGGSKIQAKRLKGLPVKNHDIF